MLLHYKEFKYKDNLRMTKPRQTLVQYQAPFETVISSSGVQRKVELDSRLAIDDLLQSMFPALEWESQGKTQKQIISTNPPTREDASALKKLLQQRLAARQARDSGICPIRQELHRQCFDEIIRQVTIDSPERGMLLLRVREQLYMTISAYETLYESSLTFSMRKQLQSEQGTPELQTTILQLEERKMTLKERAIELQKKKDNLEKQIKDKKIVDDKKRAEEIDFLKYQANHLQNFLRSVNQNTK